MTVHHIIYFNDKKHTNAAPPKNAPPLPRLPQAAYRQAGPYENASPAYFLTARQHKPS